MIEDAAKDLIEMLQTGQSQYEIMQKYCNAASIPVLIYALKQTDDRDVNDKICYLLVRTGAPAVEPLIAELDPSGPISVKAAWTLGSFGDERAVLPLIDVLALPNKYLRWAALHSLQLLSDARAIEPIILCLQDEEDMVRSSAIETLQVIGDARALLPLQAIAEDEENRLSSPARIAARTISDRVYGRYSPTELDVLKSLLEREIEVKGARECLDFLSRTNGYNYEFTAKIAVDAVRKAMLGPKSPSLKAVAGKGHELLEQNLSTYNDKYVTKFRLRWANEFYTVYTDLAISRVIGLIYHR